MKIHFLSDVHLEFGGMSYKRTGVPDCDLVILAGDIAPGAAAWPWMTRWFYDKKVAHIAGNHEYYSNKWNIRQLNHHLEQKSNEYHRFLQNQAWEFPEHGVVVLGCTLWTDFHLNGRYMHDLHMAPLTMNDYKWIHSDLDQRLTPEWVAADNLHSKHWLQENIKKYREGSWTIVVATHHAPTRKSCEFGVYAGNENNVYYANTYDTDYDFVWPDYWIHGHVHESADYEIEGCRVMTNPRGYMDFGNKPENPDFDQTLVIDL